MGKEIDIDKRFKEILEGIEKFAQLITIAGVGTITDNRDEIGAKLNALWDGRIDFSDFNWQVQLSDTKITKEGVSFEIAVIYRSIALEMYKIAKGYTVNHI